MSRGGGEHGWALSSAQHHLWGVRQAHAGRGAAGRAQTLGGPPARRTPGESQVGPAGAPRRLSQASCTRGAAWRSLSTAMLGGLRGGPVPGGEAGPSAGRPAVVWTGVRRPETRKPGPHRGARGAAAEAPLGSHALLAGAFPARPRVPAAGRRSGRVSRAETGAAPAPGGRGLAARRRLRSFCSARVCVGSCPRRAAGRDERAFCLRPSGPARLSFLI